MVANLRNKFWFVVLSCICRFIFATTFIVSGALKSIDPWGTILAIESYLATYNIAAPDWLVSVAAIGLGATELILGCLLIFGAYIRITSVISVVVMVLFSVVTLLSATVLPIEDCGCFGALIPLTPWQSFAKNMVLLPMTICFWYHYRKEQVFENWKKDLFILIIFSVAAFVLGIYSYLHLPVFDATPYRTGVNIAEEMERSRTAPSRDEVVLVYRNRHTDELHEFSVDDTTWQNDSIWVWVETRVEENAQTPTLLEFYVGDAEGDKTMLLLSKPKLYMLFMESSNYDDDIRAAFETVEQYAKINGGEVIYVTPENLDAVECAYPCYNMDPKTMKTILRAEYGLVELENGVIVGKYNYRDIPY